MGALILGVDDEPVACVCWFSDLGMAAKTQRRLRSRIELPKVNSSVLFSDHDEDD